MTGFSHSARVRIISLTTAGAVASALAFSVGGAPPASAKIAVGSAFDAAWALDRLPAFATIPDSRSLLEPVVLNGTLTDHAGRPMAGAHLLLGAWPNPETLEKMAVGSTFAVAPVARAVTDNAGRYELRAAATPLLRALQGRDGIDLELNVFHQNRHLVHLTQIGLDDGQWIRQLGADLLGPDAEPLARTLLDVKVDPRRAPQLPNPSLVASAQDHVSFPECSDYRILPPRSGPVIVATAIANDGARIETTYSSSASTEIGTGVSYDGGASFGQEGARSRSSTFEADFVDRVAPRNGRIHREYVINWRHGVQDRHCAYDDIGSYEVQVLTSPGFATGGVADRARNRDDFRCARKNSEDVLAKSISTHEARAYTYSSGFSIKPLGGVAFAGTTRSGYSEAVRITFRFPGNRGEWCGDTDVPGAPNQRVQAFK
ncbi:MAG: hypothetical protein ACT4P1_10360 [Sporichthyaceae bacterium]